MHCTVRFPAWLALSLAPLALSVAGCAAQSEGEFCSTLNGNNDCEPGLVCRSSLCCPPQGRPSAVAACMTTNSGGGGAGGAGGSAGSAGASGADAATEADAADETPNDAGDETASDAADEPASDGAAD